MEITKCNTQVLANGNPNITFRSFKSRDKANGYGTDDWGSISGNGRKFSLHCHVQTGSWAQPASYPKGSEGSSPMEERENN
jgi:hypothetical protein